MVKKSVLFSSIVGIVIVLDQILKHTIRLTETDFGTNFVQIHLVKNTGAGFGILQNQTPLLAFISFIIAALVIFHYKKIPKETFPHILFGIFLGGVIGNLIDRVFLGYVTDFIDFSFWPAFNIADMAITVAVIGIVMYYYYKK